jgi:DNA-binding HxlR family transcriptional regulator
MERHGMHRTYGEGCLAAHALDLVGDRWSLLIVRELMLGPKRFGAIRAGVPGIATNMLARRLADLTAAGIVEETVLPAPASVAAYALTRAGEALWPVIESLCRWGLCQPGHDPRRFISPTALMLSMRVTGSREGPVAGAGFVMGDEVFDVELGAGRYAVRRVARPGHGPLFRGPANALAGLIYGPRPLAEAAGMVEGDLAAAQAFADRFSLAS